MRWLFPVCLCAFVGTSAGQDPEEEPVAEKLSLPQWTAEDWEALQRGELIPGSGIIGGQAWERLFSDDLGPIEWDPEVKEIPAEKTEVTVSPTEIGEEFLSSYFHDAPTSFLVDPQGLLMNKEREGLERFLEYHAANSGLDLYFFLFDTKQEIPVDESLDGVVLDHFGGDESSAVVFYFMGDPKRVELRFSEKVSGGINRGDKRDLIKLSLEDALENEEQLAQLEAFASQLSKRLSWLERRLEGEGLLSERDKILGSKGEEKPGVLASLWLDFTGDSQAFLAVVLSVSFALSVGLFVFLRYLADRNRVFVFPDAQGSPVMGAPHAPGVGSIISYANRTQPPSLQRNNYPDYLQRM